ncbi:MAG: endolytic transglycosylase MltG [Deltaproteobacteria bacterium]|nr:endolytic transglycosylase MltG [Deltaproteobacteria bacterium]
MKKILIGSLVALLLGVGASGWYVHSALTTAGLAHSQTIVVLIPPGLQLQTIAQGLVSEGVLTNGFVFSWWARLTRADRKIKSGEYEFTEPLSPLELLHRLTLGENRRLLVTIPEGKTVKEIAAILTNKGLGTAESFLCLNTDPAFLDRWGLPAQGMEGYLFPDTYYLSRFAMPEEILGKMIERFYHVFTPAMYRQADFLNMTPHEVATFASLVEKETGADAERPLVSAVFHNRLKNRMLLQCDPTVIYGIANFDGNLTRTHLRTPTPYNTYVIPGLPPGPIANPGLHSLLATLNPADRPYLYFVGKGNGTHEFSSDLASHNRAVQQFQKRRS